MKIAVIVEGHGEVESAPILIRRIAQTLGIYDIQIMRPIRWPKQRLLKSGELERVLELAYRKLQGDGAVLVLLDADDDCVKLAGPRDNERARTACAVPVTVVYAVREYESWFLAGLVSLRGHRRIRSDADPPGAPEEIRGAKERIQRAMERDAFYSETVDQPALTEQMDLSMVREKSDSFDKLWREVEQLLASHRA